MDRPARPPAPPLPPFAQLDETHAHILRHLGALLSLVERLTRHEPDERAREEARAIHDYFASTARRHHAQEERHVFPLLLSEGDAELEQQVRRLQQDHGWLEEDWLELAPQLLALANGHSGWDIDELRHGAQVFAALYREHIGLEENLAYPRARALIRVDAAPPASA